MRLAITGGSGRVGVATVAQARRHGHDVVVLDQSEPPASIADVVAYQGCDMLDFDAVKAGFAGCDAVIHLAAIPSPREGRNHWVHQNNVVGSYNALLAAAELGIKRVVQASSVNAIGASYSRAPHYDYFPVDEHHPTYNEDAYSLSKWIAEQQADSIVRRYEDMSVASLRFHAVVTDRPAASVLTERVGEAMVAKELWGYTTAEMISQACVLGCEATFPGHEVFFVIASDTRSDVPSEELWQRHYPGVPLRRPLMGNEGFFDCGKAVRLLGWSGE
jgi:nucleoside-diphosphate-sugar epimerase